MTYMYHATRFENLSSILEKGIQPGTDGLVYMCLEPRDSAKFLAVRGCKDILVIKVKIPKKLNNTIQETFDHSSRFFGCRAFASNIPISTERLADFTRYQL